MARSILEFLLKTSKTGKGVEQTEKDLKKLDKTVQKSKKSFSLLDGITLKAGAKVYDFGVQLLKSLPALIDQGVEAQKARKALEGYAGGAYQAEQMVKALKEATGGGLSNMAAMQNAAKLLSMGLASNADEAAKLTKIAITLGASMGKGPQEAFEEFTLLLANQSILRLDTFGISAGLVRQRMEELAAQGIEPADRQARFLIATMEQAETSMVALDAAGFEAVTTLDRFDATVADSKQGLAEWVANGAMPWLDGIFAIRDATIEQNERMVEATDGYEAYRKKLEEMPIYFKGLTKAQYEAMKQEQQLREAIELGKIAQDGWQSALIESTEDTDALTKSTDNLKLSIIGLSGAEVGRVAIENLERQLESGIIDEDTYNSLLIDISRSIMGVSDSQIFASKQMKKFEQELESGEIDAAEYAAKVKQLGTNINNLKDKTVRITVKFKRVGRGHESIDGYGGGYQHGGQFMVRGPGGIDRVPVHFNATAGEVVTITPPGQAPPPSPTNQTTNNNMSIYGGLTLQGVEGAQDLLAELASMTI